MKIRTQFYLLVGGIVVVPLLLLGGVYWAQRLQESPALSIPGYDEISRLTGESVDKQSWEDFAEIMKHTPRKMEFIILDKELVVFSTIARYHTGDILSGQALLEFIRETNDDYMYQLDVPVRTADGGFLVLTRVLREGKRITDPLQRLFRNFLAFLAILFLFSAVMSISIARSITDSVMVLEAATRRIAAGDLDAPIEVHGSNEITSLMTSLNSMREALKEDQVRRSRFIMGITHDLKTPLALIKGYSEAIGDGLADEPTVRDHYLGIIGAKVDQLDGMVDDLIDFVRMDTAEWRHHLVPVELAPFLRFFTKRIEADAFVLHRRVETDIQVPDGLMIPMDERLVTRALENIVNNALRYTSEGGVVQFSADTRPGGVVLRISDNGPGISEEDLPHIFDMFYRGTGSRREQGMGLGLAVVRNVVDSHGWEINVSSHLREGSSFVLTIPIA